MKCEDFIEELQKSLDKTLEKQKCSNCQHDFKAKVHPLAVAVSGIISRVESYLPDRILRETITDLYKLRFESIEWACCEAKHHPGGSSISKMLKLNNHEDWIPK